MKKKLFTSLLAAGLVFGTVQTASAKFIGEEVAYGECFAGVRPVYTTIYFFWLEVSHGTEYEAC